MTAFSKYYQDELAFLRELGREFSEAYPSLAPMLAEEGLDPDVKRLMEGFAFLSGRIRQKLDDEYPEITHSLMGLLWPHVLRPIPSVTTIEFEPLPGVLRDRHEVKRGVQLDSVEVEGMPCRFQTTSDVDLLPISLSDVVVENPGTSRAQIRLKFQLPVGVDGSLLDVRRLRFHLAAASENAYELYLWFSRCVRNITVSGDSGRSVRTLPADRIVPVGFGKDESLWPYPKHVFTGYRLLQEYFTCASRFLYFDVTGLNTVREALAGQAFDIVFHGTRPPRLSGNLGTTDIRLYCTPAVNIFQSEGDPIRVGHERVEYRVRPAQNMRTAEVFSVDRVFSWPKGSAERQEVMPLHAFRRHRSDAARTTLFDVRLREALVGRGVETFLSFVYPDGRTAVPEAETVSVELTLTNGDLPEGLRVGDVRVSTETSPQVARFRNITRPSPTVRPPLSGELHWRLISHMALNQLTLHDAETLRGVLELYNVPALYDRQAARANEKRLDGIRDVRGNPEQRLFQGAPVRGKRVEMDLVEDHFSGEGDLYLFASIMNEFVSLYATVNSFTRFTVRCVQSGEIYSWPARIGTKNIL